MSEQKPGDTLIDHIAAHEALKHNRPEGFAYAVLLAVVMALPALGMISGGFSTGRLVVGVVGIAIFIGMGIFFFIIASLAFSNQD